MAALMERDKTKRIGAAGFRTFTSHPFFADIDFAALERKEIHPIFIPSSDKTNFDATYDLEELLLEEAPLEARARRQKPRAELREDASAKEIREDELHRLIETMFEPFDYTTVSFQGKAAEAIAASKNPEDCLSAAQSIHSRQMSQHDSSGSSPPLRNDGSSSRLNQPEAITTVGETLEESPDPVANKQPPSPNPSSSPSFHRPFHPPPQRPRGATRKTSKGGGVHMVLDASGAWTELADHSATIPADAMDNAPVKGKGNSGMLSFLSRKKGRERSPKPQEPGVLGKEGARQILG